jgi:hypothetical protein
MNQRSRIRSYWPAIAVIAVIIVGTVLALYISRAPSAPLVPPDREGTQNALPAAPGNREALPGTPRPPPNP